jgi:hypothetical protein
MLSVSVSAQKMLLIERANRAKTVRLYAGDFLEYRVRGAEDYWYAHRIDDLLPQTNTLLLDNFPVKVDSIAQIRVYKKSVVRFIGATLLTFGASLALATTFAAIYRDEHTAYATLYATSAGSFGLGWLLSGKRTLQLGKHHRLRIIEIRFPDPATTPGNGGR